MSSMILEAEPLNVANLSLPHVSLSEVASATRPERNSRGTSAIAHVTLRDWQLNLPLA